MRGPADIPRECAGPFLSTKASVKKGGYPSFAAQGGNVWSQDQIKVDADIALQQKPEIPGLKHNPTNGALSGISDMGHCTMRHIVFRLAMAGCIGLLAHPVLANSLLRQIERTGLTQQDINMMVRTGGELYANRTAQPGDDTIWSNPETGAYGSAEITSVSGNCVGINYKFKTRRQSQSQTVQTRRCLENGRWVLAP